MDLKEILEKYFKEALNEEAIVEFTTLFEASVQEKVNAEVAEAVKIKEEELEEKVASDLSEFKANLTEKLNEYAGVAVTEFVEENKVEMENSMKVEMAEKVIGQLRTTLGENYIVIPESEIDVVKDLEEKNSALEAKLNVSLNESIESKKQTFEFEKALAFKEIAEKLSDVDREKLLDLTEGIQFENIEDFKKKVGIVMTKLTESTSHKKEIKDEFENLNEKENEIDKYLPSNAK